MTTSGAAVSAASGGVAATLPQAHAPLVLPWCRRLVTWSPACGAAPPTLLQPHPCLPARPSPTPPLPACQPIFRDVMETYFGEMSRVSFKLLEAFCSALHIPLDSMHGLFDVSGTECMHAYAVFACGGIADSLVYAVGLPARLPPLLLPLPTL